LDIVLFFRPSNIVLLLMMIMMITVPPYAALKGALLWVGDYWM
jgi:hypothetical protein